MDYATLTALNMQSIQFFLTVAELGSMTKAAAVMNVTQPLLSQRIQRLETNLGITLFIRTPRKMELTPAGAYLYEQWSQVLGQVSRSINYALQLQAGETKKLTFGIYSALGQKAKYRLSREIIYAFPDYEIDLPAIQHHTIVDAIQEGQCDFALLPDYGNLGEKHGLETCTVGTWPLFALVSITNPLSERDSLTWEDLNGITWLAGNTNPDYYDALRAHAAEHHFTPDIHSYTSDDTLRLYLQLDRGVSVIMSYQLQEDDIGLKAIPIQDSDTPLIIAWKQDYGSIDKRAFANSAAPIVKEVLRTPYNKE